MPSPAWRLTEVNDSRAHRGRGTKERALIFVFRYATYRTNQELWLYKSKTGGAAPYIATLTGAAGKVDHDVTHRLTQRRWDEIYAKVLAAYTLLGRKPEMIVEIF